MTWTERLGLFSHLDYAALALLLLCWTGIGYWIEHSGPKRPSVSRIMSDFRREWMRQMVARDPRIFDAQLIGNLRQGAAFFASATMIALGGGLALVGNAERLSGVANDLTLEMAPRIFWELKLIIMLLFVANAFLKFVWAHRLFGYCSVLMAAVPNNASDPLALPRAAQAAEINITATRSFNRGMRTTYFSLAAAAWLLGPVALMMATLFTFAVLWRREFASESRAILIKTPPHTGS